LTTYQSGRLYLYTIGAGGAGRISGSASTNVQATGADLRVDFELPASGFTISVVDAQSGAPIRAHVGSRLQLKDGRKSMGWAETTTTGSSS